MKCIGGIKQLYSMLTSLLSDQIGGEGVNMLSYAYQLIYLIFGIQIQVKGKPKINIYT